MIHIQSNIDIIGSMLLALVKEGKINDNVESVTTDVDVHAANVGASKDDVKKNSENSDDSKGKRKHRMRKITVVIGSSSKSFFINHLSKLSYFKARFSSRWFNNSCDETKEIEIFPSSDTNNNCDSTFNYNQIQFNFNCDDLKFLLKCIQDCEISTDTPLELKKLESLLYCHDYFNPQLNQISNNSGNEDDGDDHDSSRFVIDEKALLNYFRDLKPPLDKEGRDTLLSDCRHPLLRRALTALNQRYQTIVKQSQIEMLSFDSKMNEAIASLNYHKNCNRMTMNENINNSTGFIESLMKTIKVDPITATKLFESRFKIHIYYVRKIFNAINAPNDCNYLSNMSPYFALNIEILHFGDTYVKKKRINIGSESKIDGKQSNGTPNKTDEKSNENNNRDDFKKNFQSILFDLWQLCEKGKHLSVSTFEAIDVMLEKVLNPQTIVSSIQAETVSKFDQAKLILQVLRDIIFLLMNDDLLLDDTRLRNTKYINIKSCCQGAILMIARYEPAIHVFDHSWHDSEIYNHLTENENEELVDCMIKVTKHYLDRCATANKRSLKDLDIVHHNTDCWITFLASTLICCSKEYIKKNAKKWFPILHKQQRETFIKARDDMKTLANYKSAAQLEKETNDDNNNNVAGDKDNYIITDEGIEEILKLNSDIEGDMGKWIIDELIQTTDQCFEFGIYLSQFVVFDHKQENENKQKIPFPQMYIDFMKKYCGINWTLL